MSWVCPTLFLYSMLLGWGCVFVGSFYPEWRPATMGITFCWSTCFAGVASEVFFRMHKSLPVVWVPLFSSEKVVMMVQDNISTSAVAVTSWKYMKVCTSIWLFVKGLACFIDSIWTIADPLQVPQLRVRVDLEGMVMKGYLTFSKTSGLAPHYLMQFNVISRTLQFQTFAVEKYCQI